MGQASRLLFTSGSRDSSDMTLVTISMKKHGVL